MGVCHRRLGPQPVRLLQAAHLRVAGDDEGALHGWASAAAFSRWLAVISCELQRSLHDSGAAVWEDTDSFWAAWAAWSERGAPWRIDAAIRGSRAVGAGGGPQGELAVLGGGADRVHIWEVVGPGWTPNRAARFLVLSLLHRRSSRRLVCLLSRPQCLVIAGLLRKAYMIMVLDILAWAPHRALPPSRGRLCVSHFTYE